MKFAKFPIKYFISSICKYFSPQNLRILASRQSFFPTKNFFGWPIIDFMRKEVLRIWAKKRKNRKTFFRKTAKLSSANILFPLKYPKKFSVLPIAWTSNRPRKSSSYRVIFMRNRMFREAKTAQATWVWGTIPLFFRYFWNKLFIIINYLYLVLYCIFIV